VVDEPVEPVVSAWLGDCPLCLDVGAFFMVYVDGGVSFRCPDCHKKASLSNYQRWEQWDLPEDPGLKI